MLFVFEVCEVMLFWLMVEGLVNLYLLYVSGCVVKVVVEVVCE